MGPPRTELLMKIPPFNSVQDQAKLSLLLMNLSNAISHYLPNAKKFAVQKVKA
jgi:hypothetical protein